MKTKLLFILTGCLLLSGCRQQKTTEVTTGKTGMEKPVVYVSNYPLFYFAQQIGSDAIGIRFPAAKLDDPSLWVPVADTIAAMQQADLILVNGASFENWMMNVSLPDEKVIITSRHFENELLTSGSTFTHSHGDEGEHAHEGTAFTTWLNLELATRQAEQVKNALVELQPNGKEKFVKNFNTLREDLMQLHQEFQNTVTKENTLKVAFSHPVYQYLAAAYGINGKSLHWEPETPIDHDMEHEIEHLKQDEGISWLIWEGEPLPENVKKLSEMGINSVVISPMGGQPGNQDFIEGMKKNLEALKKIYGIHN